MATKRTPPRPKKKLAEGGTVDDADSVMMPEEESEPDDTEVDIPPEPGAQAFDTTELEDGSAEVELEDDGPPDQTEFGMNLAEVIDPVVLGRLGRSLLDLIEQDIEARRDRDKQYAEGIKKSGLTGTVPSDDSGAEFDGASRAVHPMLAQASIDFEGRAIKELFPANGPCKVQVIGEQTEAKLDKAERKKTYMNWQATKQIEENRSVYERVLSQVPMAGAAYKRWWWDPELKRNRTEAVFLDDIFTPYGHSDFYTAPRMTYRQRILREEYERRIRTGLYRNLNLGESAFNSSMTEDSAARRASEKVEGVDPDASSYNEDGLRLVYQCDAMLDLEGEDDFADNSAPYVVHIDEASGLVLGLYRNWKEDDDRKRKKHHMTEWSFVPWRDGPALGFINIIGSLSVAGTGALRALLDSAHIQNFPGAMKLKGGKTAGQNITVNATELMEIDSPEGVMDPDIRKLVMPFPFNGPSAVLFNLLEWLSTRAEGVVATASEKLAEGGSDMPVGTAMALIEHGSTNFRAIHARLHESMMRDLEIQHRLDAEYLEDEETVEELGELVVYRSDFQGPMDIVPVSDPNIFTEAQRYAQNQAVVQLMGMPQFAPFFKPEQVLARILRLMNIPDVDIITNLPKEPKKSKATEENYALASGDRPVKVYKSDDDLLHLKVHIMFATSPMFGANPMMSGQILPGMVQHCKEHLLALYQKHTTAATDAVKTVLAAQGTFEGDPNSEGDDMAVLQAVALAEQELNEKLAPMVMPGIAQMQQALVALAQQNQPKASPDVAANIQGQLDLEKLKQQGKQAEMAAKTQMEMFQEKMEQMVQAMTDQSTERLAKLASTIELIKQQQDIGGKSMLQAEASEQAQQLAVLNAAVQAIVTQLSPKPAPMGLPPGEEKTPGEGGLVEAAPPAPAPSPMEGADMSPLVAGIQQVVARQIAELLAVQEQRISPNMESNMLAMLQRESATNQAAFDRLAEGIGELKRERHSEIFVGPDGKKRARSFYPEPDPQPEAAPPVDQPPPQE